MKLVPLIICQLTCQLSFRMPRTFLEKQKTIGTLQLLPLGFAKGFACFHTATCNFVSCIYFRSVINAQLRTDWWNTLIGKVRTLCGWLPSHPILVAWAVCNMPWVAGWSVKIMDGTSSDASLIQSFVTHSCNALHTGQTLFLIFFQSSCNLWIECGYTLTFERNYLNSWLKECINIWYYFLFYRDIWDICVQWFCPMLESAVPTTHCVQHFLHNFSPEEASTHLRRTFSFPMCQTSS